MTLNRYDILTNHYTTQIHQWNWKDIVSRLSPYEPEGFNPKFDDPLEGAWLGTVLGLYPSGKIYAPWTTNQTRSDVVKDECFMAALEGVAASYGLFLDFQDDGVFVTRIKNPLPAE